MFERNFFLFLPVVVLLAWAVVVGLLEVFLLGGNKPSLVSVVPGCLGLVALPVFLIWSLRYRIYDYYTYDYYSKKSRLSAIEEDQRSRASSAGTQSASTNCGSLRLTRFFKVLADYVLFYNWFVFGALLFSPLFIEDVLGKDLRDFPIIIWAFICTSFCVLLCLAILTARWIRTCYKEFRATGKSDTFSEVISVLFGGVAICAVGFVVWYFVTSLQKSWRDTADLKKATIELLEETKKQNRAAGID